MYNNSVFSVKPISINDCFSNIECYIEHACRLKDSRIAVLLFYYYLNFSDHKIIIIDPISFQKSFEFDFSNACYHKIDQLPNGHIITFPEVHMFDISNQNNIKKYDIKADCDSYCNYELLPNNELAILYQNGIINVHHCDTPYHFKYTLRKKTANTEGKWIKFIFSIKMLMVCLRDSIKYTRSFHFIDLESKEVVTYLQLPKAIIFPNLIELENKKLLIQDEDSFFVLNLKSFLVEIRFDYYIKRLEKLICHNLPFLVKIDRKIIDNMQIINDKSKIENSVVLNIGNENIVVIRFKEYCVPISNYTHSQLFLSNSSELFELTNNYHYNNYKYDC